MRILVTRPRPDAERTAAELAARGHEPTLAPLLEIVPEPGPAPDLAGVQAVLATSANGARALARAAVRRDVPVFAVGAVTAAAARENGFAAVESAGGDVAALADLAAGRLKPGGGRLLHVAGSHTAGDLSGRLAARGFEVERLVLYRAEPAGELPDAAAGALRRGALDGVLLYSPRTAEIFARLAAARGLADACASLRAFCLSRAVAGKLGGLSFAAVRVAADPDQDSLLRLLDG